MTRIPALTCIPFFSCGSADLSSEQSKAVAAGISFYKDNFKLIPEKLVEGRNGQGNLDYAVECRPTGRILGVVEVKKEDFMKGFAQASKRLFLTFVFLRDTSHYCKKNNINSQIRIFR
ncbi:hypothetical protein GLOIN_2v1867626 [Rhizophagus irregularis DAOM 181602=DAOM 197198]|nr:hypothetical protein GLOIN_2v1867626 [Rhizophagus irregularis DAOM 181602=DAOM 197198]